MEDLEKRSDISSNTKVKNFIQDHKDKFELTVTHNPVHPSLSQAEDGTKLYFSHKISESDLTTLLNRLPGGHPVFSTSHPAELSTENSVKVPII